MSTKKTPSLASPLDAHEVKYRKPKSRKKERSIREEKLAEIARFVYFKRFLTPVSSWSKHPRSFRIHGVQ